LIVILQSKIIMNIYAKQREDTLQIDISGTIGGYNFEQEKMNTSERIKNELSKMGPEGKVEVTINSLGGYVGDGIAIFELLHSMGDRVTTKMVGHCASAATLVAMGGGKRIMSKYALVLIHRSWCYAEGNAIEIQEQMEKLQKIDDEMLAIYADVSGKSKDEISELMDANEGRGKWLSADEAKEYGLIDEIVDGREAKNDLGRRAMALAGYPDMPEGYMVEGEIMLPQLINNDTKMNIKEQYACLSEVLPQAELDKKENLVLDEEAMAKVDAAIAESKAALESEKEAHKSTSDELEKAKAEIENMKAEAEENKGKLEEAEKKAEEAKALYEQALANAKQASVSGEDHGDKALSAWDQYCADHQDIINYRG